jgi:hypothetical protein
MPLAENGLLPTAEITLIVINIMAARLSTQRIRLMFPLKKYRTFTTQFLHSLIV